MSVKDEEQYKFLAFGTREEAVSVAVQLIESELDLAAEKFGVASFLASGGSSPKPIYETLSRSDIAWDKIAIALVDERWVSEDMPGSNARFLRETLLQNQAAKAGFLGMTTPHARAREGLAEINMRYRRLNFPFDMVLMGMGTDGHTASWFPGSEGLAAAMHWGDVNLVREIDASDCPGAGDYPERVTITLGPILSARKVILFITGEAKRAVFEAALEKEVSDAPVKALLDLRSRLTVIWAP